MPRRKANSQPSMVSLGSEAQDGAPDNKKAKRGPKKGKKSKSAEQSITIEPQHRNKSLDALFHITDLELQNMSKSTPAAGPTEAAPNNPALPAETQASTSNMHHVVRIPGHDKGIEKYQVKSDSLEEQGLKLVYTKQAHEQFEPNPVGYGSYRPRGFKGQGDQAASPPPAVQLNDVQVGPGRKRKHPQKPGRHICPYCGRGCAKPSVLQKHIRAHTGERPYPCIPCGFSFKTKSNLYKHCKSRAHAQKAGQSPNFGDAKMANDDITDSEEDGISTDTEEDIGTENQGHSVKLDEISQQVAAVSGGTASMVYKTDKAYYDIVPSTATIKDENVPVVVPVTVASSHQMQSEREEVNVQALETTDDATAALRQLECMSDKIAQVAANANVAVTSSVQTLPDKSVRVTIQLQKQGESENTSPDAMSLGVSVCAPELPKPSTTLTTVSTPPAKPLDHKVMTPDMLSERIQQLISANQAIVDTPMADPPRQKRLSRQNSEVAKSGNDSPRVASRSSSLVNLGNISASGIENMDTDQQIQQQSFLGNTETSDRPPGSQFEQQESGLSIPTLENMDQEIKIQINLPKPNNENVPQKSPQNPEGSVIKDLLLKGPSKPTLQINTAMIQSMVPANRLLNEDVSPFISVVTGSSAAVDDYGPHLCQACNVSFRKEESLNIHQKFYCETAVIAATGTPRSLSVEEQAQRERDILNRIFPEVPHTPVSPSKKSRTFSVSNSSSTAAAVSPISHTSEPSKDTSSPRKKGRPRGSKNKPKESVDYGLAYPVHFSTNYHSPTPNGGSLIQMAASNNSPQSFPVGTLIPQFVPMNPILMRRSFSFPTGTAPMQQLPPLSIGSQQLLDNTSTIFSPATAPVRQSTSQTSIHEKIENIIANATVSVSAPKYSVETKSAVGEISTAVSNVRSSPSTSATSSPSTPQEKSSSKNLWKLQLRGKLLMKRSMSVERMLSCEDGDKTPTPTKIMSHPNLMCPLPPEAPKLLRSITIDATPMSTDELEGKPKKLETISEASSRFSGTGPAAIKVESSDVESSSLIKSVAIESTSDSQKKKKENAPLLALPFSGIPLAQAGSMPFTPNLVQGGILPITVLLGNRLAPVTLPTNQGMAITFPALPVPATFPKQAIQPTVFPLNFGGNPCIRKSPTTPSAIMAILPRTPTAKMPKTPTLGAQLGELSPHKTLSPAVNMKQMVPALLAGHSLATLRSSTHVSFCCVQQSQPMYVQQDQGTSRKISMYSNWRVAAFNPNPPGLTARMLFGLYKSKQDSSDPVYCVAKANSAHLGILTHSSYWNYYNKLKALQNLDKTGDSDGKAPLIVKLPSDIQISTDDIKGIMHTTGPSTSVVTKDVNKEKTLKLVAGGYKSNDYYTYVRGRGRGKYVCEECGIRCKKPSMLKKHIRTHTDLRPYSCKYCNFSFKTKGNLTKHMKSKAHHKKCTELGIIPVPTCVDDSQIDSDQLEKQQEISRESEILEDEEELKYRKRMLERGMSQDDGDEDDDDDDEDDDDDDDDGDDSDESLMIHEDDDWDQRKRLDNTPEKLRVPPTDGQKVIVMPISESYPGLIPAPGRLIGEAASMSSHSRNVSDPILQRQAIDAEIARSLLDLSNQTTSHTPIEDKEEDNSQVDDACKNPRLETLIGALMSRTKNTESNPSTSKTAIQSLNSEIPTEGLLPRKRKLSTGSQGSSSSASGEPPRKAPFYVPLATPSEREIHSATIAGFMPPIISNQLRNISGVYGPIVGQMTGVNTQQATVSRSPFQFMHPFAATCQSVLPADVGSANVTVSSKSMPTSVISRVESDQPVNLCVKDDVPESRDVQSPGSKSSRVSSPGEIVSPSTKVNSHVFFVTSDNHAPYEIHPIPGRMTNDTEPKIDGKYLCGICNKSFQEQHQLKLHKNIHYFENSYKCDDCSLSFRTEGQLEKHLHSESHFQKHNLSQKFGFASVENPRPFKCSYCDTAFRIHGHLAKHLRSKAHIQALEKLGKIPYGTYDQIQPSDIDATDCESSLRSIIALAGTMPKSTNTKHLEVQVPSEERSKDLGSIYESILKSSQDDAYAPVTTSPYDVYEKSNSASSNPVTVEVKNEPIEKHETESYVVQNEDVSITKTCSICQEVMDSSAQLQIHLNSKHASSDHMFQCPETGCNKEFMDRGSLHCHIESHTPVKESVSPTNKHSGGKPSSAALKGPKCGICEKIFPNINALKQHLVCHAELRPYVCEYCDAGFTTAQSLKVHLRTHKQEQPYVCGICGDTFASIENLQTHMKLHQSAVVDDQESTVPSQVRSSNTPEEVTDQRQILTIGKPTKESEATDV